MDPVKVRILFVLLSPFLLLLAVAVLASAFRKVGRER